MTSETINGRLKDLISALGLTDSGFADACNISRPTLSLLLSGKNKKISDNQIKSIHDSFPQVSIMWLLFNEGPMFNDKHDRLDNSDNPQLTLSEGNSLNNLSNEISFFPGNPSEEKKNFKENGVNLNIKEIKQAVKEEFISLLKNEDFINKIEMSRKLKRKVIKIIVYYDDSTFESFLPGQE